jgi:peptidoglycan glycosyltransferase
VNRQIVQLFGLFTLLFAVLLAFTSRWTVFEASSLEDNPDNRRPLIEEQKVPRGLILASDGTVLARSRGQGRGENRTYTRTYPAGGLFAHPVGFSFIKNGRRSLELSRNDDLVGEEDEFESILAGLESRAQEGNDVVTTLDVRGTQAAVAGLAGRKGAVVAIEPSTGKVRVMVSIPEYDPNLIPSQIGQLNRDRANQPLLNRTTQELYPPGSTFKVVTASAALDTGAVKPETVIDGSSPKEISGVPLENAGGESFGAISVTDALTNSVNTVWAQIGERIGRDTLVEYMKRFGFYEDPQLDYPGSQMIPSGIINGDGDYVDDGFDAGRVAIGQGGLEGEIRSGPLQMAEVAAAIGNGGRLMKPRLTDRIVRKDGRVKEKIQPDLQAVVMKPETAEQLRAMMSRVVEEGTGTAAALEGIPVAGKTGTAEVGANREFTQPWFICFAPVENPRMAVAVTLERTSGQGGTVAAPIAKSVLEALLGGGGG